jgi:hypothetical protein
MFRSCSRGLSQTQWVLRGLPGRSRSLPPIRLASTGSQGGGSAAGKLALAGIVTVTGLAGGTVAYANYDKEFR